MESILNYFANRVYAGTSWDSVVPIVTVRVQEGHTVERNQMSKTDSLETVLGCCARSARKIYLLIQQCEHAPISRRPLVGKVCPLRPRNTSHDSTMAFSFFNSAGSAENSSD